MIVFIQEVFDKVAEKCPEVTLYIVGKNPTDKLKKLVINRKNIIVTGKVDSVFSYIKSSTIYISPLRIGSGKKNKIIEAISCGTPLIASTVSMEGFEDIEDKNLILRIIKRFIFELVYLDGINVIFSKLYVKIY